MSFEAMMNIILIGIMLICVYGIYKGFKDA